MPRKGGDTFEWDENKRALNAQKHGIDFVDVVKIFSVPGLTARTDRDGESRLIRVGQLHQKFIAVIHTIRGDAYRIISARRAR